MKRRDKQLLLLVAVLVLAVGVGVFLAQRGGRSGPVVASAPAEPAPARGPVRPDPIPPPGATAVENYLENRWSHLETPLVAPIAEGTGDRMYLMKDAVEGRSGDGKVQYAVGMARLIKFDDLKTFKKKDHVQGPVLQIDNYEPSELMKRFGKPKRVPLDQLPDGAFKNRPPNIPLESDGSAEASPTPKAPKAPKKGKQKGDAGPGKKGKKGKKGG